MAHVTGRSGKLQVSAAGSTYTDIGGVRDVSMPHSRDTIETTDFDDGGWKSFLAGNGTATISASGFYDASDAGQDLLWTAHAAAATYYFRFRPAGTGVGLDQWTGQAIITSVELSEAVDGAVEFSLELQFTGQLTLSAQT